MRHPAMLKLYAYSGISYYYYYYNKLTILQSFLINPVFDIPILLTNLHKNVCQMGINVKIPIQIDSIIRILRNENVRFSKKFL